MENILNILLPTSSSAQSIKDLLSDQAMDLYYKYQYPQDNTFPFSNYTIYPSPEQGAFFCDKSDYIKNYLSLGKTWEPHCAEIIQKYTKKGSIAIDIGAHIGIHTVNLSSCVGKEGVVLAFELQKKIYIELVANCRLNSCSNVLAFHAALGSQAGTVYLGPEHPSNEGARYISSKHQIEAVSQLALDELFLHHVSFIKIDVENYEQEVLNGAKQTILRNKPTILIEIGGGLLKTQEEKSDAVLHTKSIIDFLKNELHYLVIPILTTPDFTAGEYLALPNNE